MAPSPEAVVLFARAGTALPLPGKNLPMPKCYLVSGEPTFPVHGPRPLNGMILLVPGLTALAPGWQFCDNEMTALCCWAVYPVRAFPAGGRLF